MLNINSNCFGNLYKKSTRSFFTKTFYFFVIVLCIGLTFPSGSYAQSNETVTNKTIIDLSKAGIGKQIILAKIENSICNFDLSTDGLIALKKSGVPDDIVATMISKGSTPAQAANDQPQNNNTQDQPARTDGDQNTQAIPTANTAPPELPAYEQPPCPVDGYLWVPGYWAFNPVNGYYWVPGVWVAPPDTGLLWTPAYWGFNGIAFIFHPGYWGARVGFYGGINYGYGYGGYGFVGGSWSGRYFRYNTAVVRVNTTVIHNTYVDRTVIRTTVVNRTSFNGRGGIVAKPRPEEEVAMRERHIQPTREQFSHQQLAGSDKNQFARVNNGHPTQAAMVKVNNTVVKDQAAGNTNLNKNNTTGVNKNQVNSPNQAVDNNIRPTTTGVPANNANRPAATNNIPGNDANHPTVNTPATPNNGSRPLTNLAPAANNVNHPVSNTAPATNNVNRPANNIAPAANTNRPAPTQRAATPAPQRPQQTDNSKQKKKN